MSRSTRSKRPETDFHPDRRYDGKNLYLYKIESATQAQFNKCKKLEGTMLYRWSHIEKERLTVWVKQEMMEEFLASAKRLDLPFVEVLHY